MTIGATIKKLRQEQDVTQEQLAEALGITSRAVSQWECDRTAPDISQLPALANFFDVTTDRLLGVDIRRKEEAVRRIVNGIPAMCGYAAEKQHYRENPGLPSETGGSGGFVFRASQRSERRDLVLRAKLGECFFLQTGDIGTRDAEPVSDFHLGVRQTAI